MNSPNMPRMYHLWRRLMFGILVFMLAACSKVIKWEEEVLLNTDEKILVERKVIFKYRSTFANPLKYELQPTGDVETSFEYKGKNYHYKGDLILMTLFISSEGNSVLFAPAPKAWVNNNNYICADYVKLTPTPDGKWLWSPNIENYMYGSRANLGQLFMLLNTERRFFDSEYILRTNEKSRTPNYMKTLNPNYRDRCLLKNQSTKGGSDGR